MRDPDFTLSAGPTMASSPRVLAALGSPITYHYDPAFLERFRAPERKVAELFRTKSDVVLMQGEAVLGLEAAARALVRPGMPVLNSSRASSARAWATGSPEFGAELARGRGAVQRRRSTRRRSSASSASTRRSSCSPSSTRRRRRGRSTRSRRSGRSRKRHGALMIVDCVSSLGGDESAPDEWRLDICVAGAAEVPRRAARHVPHDRQRRGLGARSARTRRAARLVPVACSTGRSSGSTAGKFPFTPSVVDMHGVEAALRRGARGRARGVVARHAAAARAHAAPGCEAMGLDLWPRSEEVAADCVTALAVPRADGHAQVRAHCRERYGVMISGGPGRGEARPASATWGPTARSLYPVVGARRRRPRRSPTSVRPVKLGDGARGGARGALAERSRLA